ncbi:MAG: methyltransferase domain-containing protein [Hyphomicrobiales bacterium]|nr:methyltransferase domain-containing protein [Hyphomicrobiales bacterium]
MHTGDRAFVGSIPDTYDRLLVPLLFAHYAEDLADRIRAFGPKDMLETAAGTGVVARALAARGMADTTTVATDLNEPMLDYARRQSPQPPRITWRHADALALPFAGASFDLVACQFGTMFFPDKVEGFAEARRVLRPGGRLVFSVWDRISENELADVVTDALAELFPDDPPRFLARIPHGYFEPDTIRQDLSRAGFRHIETEAVDAWSTAPSPRGPATAYCQGTPLRSEIESRGAPGLEHATRHAADALARRFGAGPIKGRMRAVVVTAAY